MLLSKVTGEKQKWRGTRDVGRRFGIQRWHGEDLVVLDRGSGRGHAQRLEHG